MSSSANIAIVDDDEPLGSALANLVSSYGFDVETFGTAEELLASSGLGRIDVLVTDFGLPGMNGIQLTRTLAKSWPEMPSILMSANMDAQMVHTAQAAGVHACLAKPFAAEDLIDALTAALRS